MCLSTDNLYMKAQKFFHLKQDNVTTREFSIKLNSSAKYVSRVASSDKGKLDVFLRILRLDITNDVMMGYKPLRSLLEALGRTLRLEAIRQRMARE